MAQAIPDSLLRLPFSSEVSPLDSYQRDRLQHYFYGETLSFSQSADYIDTIQSLEFLSIDSARRESLVDIPETRPLSSDPLQTSTDAFSLYIPRAPYPLLSPSSPHHNRDHSSSDSHQVSSPPRIFGPQFSFGQHCSSSASSFSPSSSFASSQLLSAGGGPFRQFFRRQASIGARATYLRGCCPTWISQSLIFDPPEVAYNRIVAYRDRWPSRAASIFAIVGAVIGVPHLYYLPETAARFGGSIFFIPYLICLIFFAFPVLRLELCLGQVTQGGIVKATSVVHRRSKGVALAALLLAVIASWAVSRQAASNCYFFFNSFATVPPWAISPPCRSFLHDKTACDEQPFCWWELSEEAGGGVGNCHSKYALKSAEFLKDTLNQRLTANPFLGFGSLSWTMIACLLACWMATFLLVSRSIMFQGYIIALSLVFFACTTVIVAAMFYSGSQGHSTSFFFRIHYDTFTVVFTDWAVWSNSFSLAMSSLLCSSGIIHAFASYTPIGQNVVADSWFILSASLLASLMYCVTYFVKSAIFHSTANLAWVSEVPLLHFVEDIAASWGTGFATMAKVMPAFLLYPQSLASLYPSSVASMFFFFSITVILLMSMAVNCEVIVTTLLESRACDGVRRGFIAFLVCGSLSILSLSHSTDIGWIFSEWLSYFIFTYVFYIVVLFEMITIGWIYGSSRQVLQLGRRPVVLYGLVWLLGSSGCAVVWRLPGASSRRLLFTVLSFVCYGVIVILGSAGCLWLCPGHLSLSAKAYWLTLANVEELRHNLNRVVRRSKRHVNVCEPCLLSLFWSVSIKYLVPLLCTFTIVSNTITIAQHAFDASTPCQLGSVPWWWVAVGVGLALSAMFLMLSACVWPSMWNWITPPDSCMWSVRNAPIGKRLFRTSRNGTRAPPVRFYEGLKPAAKILMLPPEAILRERERG